MQLARFAGGDAAHTPACEYPDRQQSAREPTGNHCHAGCPPSERHDRG
jgi:hypothetical protein